jgi:hypothetical protein
VVTRDATRNPVLTQSSAPIISLAMLSTKLDALHNPRGERKASRWLNSMLLLRFPNVLFHPAVAHDSVQPRALSALMRDLEISSLSYFAGIQSRQILAVSGLTNTEPII